MEPLDKESIKRRDMLMENLSVIKDIPNKITSWIETWDGDIEKIPKG